MLTASQAQARHVRDTVHFRKSIAEKQLLVLSDSALNEIGIDSLLNKIENVHNTLNTINNSTSIGFDTRDIENNLPDIDSNIDIIDDNVSLYSSVLDVKNLQMFDVLLNSLQNQLTDWRNLLFKYNKEMVGMENDMNAIRKDTILRELMADSAFRSLYINEINDLKAKWAQAKKATSGGVTRLSQLQASVSNEYFTTIDLQNKIKDLLRKISIKSVGKEYPYLWKVNTIKATDDSKEQKLAQKSYHGQQRILRYYFKRNWDDQLYMLLAGIAFSLWIFRNFKKLEKDKTEPVSDLTIPFRFIRKITVLSTLVVLFNIAPFFDIHPPTAYVEISEFLLVIALTFLLWKNWPRSLFYYWLAIGALYIIFSFSGTLLTPSVGFRIFLFLLNLVSVFFGILWLRKLRNQALTFKGMIRLVSVIYIVFNLAAAFCNAYGRLSLSKILSVTAIYGLSQIIGLSVFIQIVTEAFDLQTRVNKLSGGMTAKFDFKKIERLLARALMIIAICIWLIVFTISLNLYNLLFTKMIEFLTTPRKMGSTSFEIGNILLFVLIVYISNILQQGIGSLYGRTEGAWDPEVKKNGSRLAMTRLVLIILGFLIAVAASGIPLDKITIVLGALGVGIGLGLQSIVNNLVSGVILIFEQPFRIGDFIELGDKKGRVLDIGIRSSKMVMEEGAEIIMPNADLLSGRVINWTLRNDNVRIELPMNVAAGHTFEEVRDTILEELAQSKYIIKSTPPEILLIGYSDKGISINVLIWINDVHRLQSIKSELLNSIYSSLEKKGIKVA
jgi:small-conductance mechanosensitive channel